MQIFAFFTETKLFIDVDKSKILNLIQIGRHILLISTKAS